MGETPNLLGFQVWVVGMRFRYVLEHVRALIYNLTELYHIRDPEPEAAGLSKDPKFYNSHWDELPIKKKSVQIS